MKEEIRVLEARIEALEKRLEKLERRATSTITPEEVKAAVDRAIEGYLEKECS
ncbi:DUF5320 domain-containing protein [Nitratifractor salsuginis]|uniref:Uncharacterized protein n=1 Tax=Nitratifractor salsuginis (strain DSM 16511 / JCM 12458 / E9I37-1) TaxID=749222 RepID=E6X1Q8_NITSE|nr:DUF5320 domain-containing protein [Nitratifractor salsuginis]ADV47049.1 hypothetical protein Nitsa_1804 [Nitratifractor salsuginis DSM 16511]